MGVSVGIYESGRCAMTDIGLETAGGLSTNGGSERLGLEPKATVLAKEDTVSGRLHLKGSGQVLGNFSGQIECDGDLLIGPEADVEAEIHSVTVTVAGVVRGNIVATNRLKITSSGRLEGDANVGALVVQEGGVHRGVIRVHPEGLPSTYVESGTDTMRPAVVPLKAMPNPVGRVRKFWGEFF
jgi:cytoskeletal protein CcmA (bactofilin family)